MSFLKNEKGITMVELLAALALVSMVSVLIMTTLGIGFKHSIAETNKTSTQQEANLIISKLLNNHRKGECYFIKEEINVIKVAPISCESATVPASNLFKPVSNPQFAVSLISPSQKINPKKEDYSLKAQVAYKKAEYQINTKLNRYITIN